MSKVAAFCLLILVAMAAMPWPAGATPNHPDAAVRLAMERMGPEVRLRADVDNEGGRAAKNVQLHLTLPDGGWTVDAGQGRCNGSGERKECRLKQLDVGEAWTVRALLRDAPCEAMSASARVHAPSDKDHSNDQARSSLESTCGPADVGVQKLGFRFLGTVTFTMSVTNHGPKPSRSILLIDDLPFVGLPWRVEGPHADDCTLTRLRLECRWYDVPALESRVVQVSAETNPCQTVTNTVRVYSSDDPNRENDASTARVEASCYSTAQVPSPGSGGPG